jgi:hypothetical protein
MILYPLAATVISAAFAGTLLGQYRTRRRPYLLVWAIALTIYAAAALTEVFGTGGWTPVLFKAYYFLGGIPLVGVLALGTITLLAPRYARVVLVILVLLSALGLVAVAGATLRAATLVSGVPDLKAIPAEGGLLNVLAIAIAALINIVGSLILIGGALWSAYALWRKGAPAHRLWTNILIAAGAFIVAGAASLYRLFNASELFYVGQAVGVLVMFGGFLLASRAPARATRLGIPAPS